MGERKGQNFYYPPDWRPEKGNLNKYHGTHALRERARKIHLGIIIIRFEMPYNIWCDGCGNHIGTGVRYNAEKKKVGMYYTTPVYQFRMKCHLCDNHFEIKTDPANLDYIIVSGARRQERRWDPTENEQVVPEDKETSRKLFDDAMFKLEHQSEDTNKAKDIAPNLSRLESLQGRWRDDYDANSVLRERFRARKKELKTAAEADNDLLRKSSLLGSIKLVPEAEEDKKMASLLRLAPAQSFEERQRQKREEINNRPVLASNTPLKMKQNASSTLTRASLGVTLKADIHSNSNMSKEDASSTSGEIGTKQVQANSLVSADYESSSEED